MLLNYAHYSFVIQIQSRYDETTHFSSEMQKVLQKFFRQRYDETTQACKTFTMFKNRKKAFNFEFI